MSVQAFKRAAGVTAEDPEAVVVGSGVQARISRGKQEYDKVFHPDGSDATKVFLISLS